MNHARDRRSAGRRSCPTKEGTWCGAPNCAPACILMWMPEIPPTAPLDLKHPQSGPDTQIGDTHPPGSHVSLQAGQLRSHHLR